MWVGVLRDIRVPVRAAAAAAAAVPGPRRCPASARAGAGAGEAPRIDGAGTRAGARRRSAARERAPCGALVGAFSVYSRMCVLDEFGI